MKIKKNHSLESLLAKLEDFFLVASCVLGYASIRFKFKKQNQARAYHGINASRLATDSKHLAAEVSALRLPFD